MGSKKAFYKITAVLFLVAFCIMGPAGSSGTVTYGESSYQDQIDDAKEKKEQLEKEKKELEAKMASLQVEKDNLEKAIEQLDSEYSALSDEMESTEADIITAETELEDIKAELVRMEQVAADQYEAMKSRIKYLYENGEESLFSLFLSGDSIEKIFNEMEYRSEITKYDNELLNRYNETIASIEEAEELQTARIEELQALKEYQETQLASLDTLASEKTAQLQEMAAKLGVEEEDLLAYSSSITDTQNQIKELEVLEAERLAKIEEERKKAESQDIKNMLWPLDGYSTITSKFGYRVAPKEGASTYHQGIDIGAPSGTDVHAALAGTVTMVGYNYQSGNYVMIDHGNGVWTWYCHASKVLVKVGDVVKRDQVIMKVGSTGVATGPHLHFSVYINGVTVDPLKYVSYNR